ncbi:vitamin K epoxide reductase family protein [Kibdelosporangium phytohabitans]|uniref:Vitamin K epoxide reductase n=1 Tax=Kibdelosporangium phytohabitans TaxID=860235 RepID=A0A0N9I1X9_9PSEU|nr:vitamin K epoxide reductase family protein [Kibdelosporangium phytohabitans]ALG10029.1 vitamin K epoxide reductase [Kibdelosporangium phytohabitans]MBE1460995.1 putative membrane protein [Kibdelosporangium phytohabitans]
MTTNRRLAWLYVIGGGFGLVAAIALTLEKIAKLRDPAYVPTCSINPVVSCGSVMDSRQAEAFGFPNPLLGIALFAVVVTTGVVVLAGFEPPRWYRLAMQVGTALGVVFVHWLIVASLYDIHALCPYCMVVWVVTIPLFWYTTLDTWPALAPLRRVHSVVLVLWYLVIVVLILVEFWYYWRTLL